MGDIGEYWNEHREKEQNRKADQLKWNTDILYWAKEEYGFKLKKHTDFHYSLYDSENNRTDVWPSTGKAMSFHKNKTTFAKIVNDLEAYLLEHFKPKE